MSEKYKYENGAIHLDHHKELHLGTINGSNIRDLMRDFFEQDAENVDIYEEVTNGLAEIQEDMKELRGTNNKVVSTAESLEDAIRRSLEKLMQERITVKKGGKEVVEFLFNRQNHWQGVYRILVDKKYCKDSDFEGFDIFILKVMPDQVNKPYKKDSVKQISKTDFNIPFEKWKYDGETSGNRKVYDRMYAVVNRFKELLEEEGL